MTSDKPNDGNPKIEIRDDEENHQYVIEADGQQAGRAIYHLRGGRHFFVHTEIDPEFAGGGLGRELVKYALDDVRSKDGSIVPICPFFISYIKRHPEYDDMVDHEIMARVERAREKEETKGS